MLAASKGGTAATPAKGSGAKASSAKAAGKGKKAAAKPKA
jgi:hypothetical protein